jgi:DnaD/phage-associated family protein
MFKFSGFPEGKTRLVPIPAQFFSDILPSITHLGELKLLLQVFWLMDQMEGSFRYLLGEDFINDERFLSGMGDSHEGALAALKEALHLLVTHAILLEVALDIEGESVSFYFLNTPKGRAAIESIERDEWLPTGDPAAPLELALDRPNIYRLYEENIGPLTPMISESLAEAEDTYPAKWIEDAFRIAVEKNSRNWRYIAAILDRWQQKGRYERQDRRDTEEARRRYADWED